MSGLGRPAERFSVVAFPHSDGAVVSRFLCRVIRSCVFFDDIIILDYIQLYLLTIPFSIVQRDVALLF